jgi:hypothetical protein
MDKKVLALFLLFLTSASLLTLGCADRENTGAGGLTITPTAEATVASPTVQASVAPTAAPSATAPSATPGPGSAGTPSSGINLDPSLADITGEDNDLTGFPETGLPTPTLD